jgi:SAM-dependent methyltransferase
MRPADSSRREVYSRAMRAAYDRIGATYTATRRPDPRIQRAIWDALADARSVVNVGAGTGSYEPPATVLAVEPSAVMIGQRPPAGAPAVQARAERIPLADGACDAALAVLTVHHWSDRPAGIAEMRRVARRLVVLTHDPAVAGDFWLVRDYLPEVVEFDRGRMPSIDQLCAWMGGDVRVTPVPIPHDCSDGFLCAFWRRPQAYLDPLVRNGISTLAQLGAPVQRALTMLAADLESGAWERRNGALLELDEADFGYRLLVTR